MSTSQESKELIQRHLQLLNQSDVAGYMAMYADDCVFHGYPPQVPPDHAGVTQFYEAVVAAFPDVRVTVEDTVGEGDRLAVRYVLTGTHAAPFLGAPPTGRTVSVEGITVLHLSGGRITERWNRLDELALLTEIGALTPTPAKEATT